jgi:hypothetical protein
LLTKAQSSFWWLIAGMSDTITVTAVPQGDKQSQVVVKGTKERLLMDFAEWPKAEYGVFQDVEPKAVFKWRSGEFVLEGQES